MAVVWRFVAAVDSSPGAGAAVVACRNWLELSSDVRLTELFLRNLPPSGRHRKQQVGRLSSWSRMFRVPTLKHVLIPIDRLE